MLLGLSGLDVDAEIDPGQLADGAGVPNGKLLVDFVNATGTGGDELAAARDRLVEELGPDALADVAAVVANFTMMTRIADGTGTPLDKGSVDMSADIRRELGIDGLVSARHVDEVSGGQPRRPR